MITVRSTCPAQIAARGLAAVAFVGLAFNWLAVPPATRGEPIAAFADAFADAELTDVFFLDPETGWAVGDRGAIWSTHDGGRQWRLRESPLACRWEAIWFVDSQHGWIVGGWHQPATGQSRGAVLRTRDGGQNWMPVPVNTLPRLLRVRFDDAQRGWAVGEPTPLYPTGVFRSEDGGRSWSPLPGPNAGSWLTGDWSSTLSRNRSGLVAGRHGVVAQLTTAGVVPQTLAAARGRAIRALSLASTNATPASGRGGQPATRLAARPSAPSWLAGDEGLVLRSDDGGLTWHDPPAPPPPVCDQFDWHAIAVGDGRVWIVGDPGSVVLHSADGGESWQLLRTTETVPLRAARFFDRQRGWAVGALGQILATRDGGQTWKRVQGRGRVALLGLFSDESRLPLELFAQASGNDGYLAVAELLFSREQPAANESPDGLTSAQYGASTLSAGQPMRSDGQSATRDARADSRAARVHAALVEVGASGGGIGRRFPVEDRGLEPSAERAIATWNTRYHGQAFERLVEHLTLRLRTWRPEVVVTEDAVGDGADPLATITRQAVLAAIQRAAAPTSSGGPSPSDALATWQVKKAYGQVAATDRGVVTYNATQLAPRLGRPIGDVAARGRWQLEATPRPQPASVAFRSIFNADGLPASRRDIMEGVALPAGTDGRRELSPAATRADVADLARIAQRQRMLQQLMLRGGSTASAGPLPPSTESAGSAAPAFAAGASSQGAAVPAVGPLGASAATTAATTVATTVATTAPSVSNPPRLRSNNSLFGGLAGGAWLAQLDTLVQGTGNQSAGELYWQLGQRLHEAGQSTNALETWALLATRLPHHELADAALVRLLELMASGEQRYRVELATRDRLTQATQAAGVAVTPAATPRVVAPASFEAPGRSLDDPRVPGEKFALMLEQTRPALFADPALKLVWLTALRAGGRRADVETLLRNASRPQWMESAAKALADEAWLLQADERPVGQPPRVMVDCPLALNRPRLDGRLDEPLWASAAVCPLPPSPALLAGEAGSATARVARDGEFLYLSATCQRLTGRSALATAGPAADAAGTAASAAWGPRTRDAALEGRDRVEFLLDVDRDYRTAFRLVCDERGWTFESSADDPTWNPTWYVAAAHDDDTWTIEAAIAWDQLVRSPPLPGTIWAVGVQRIAPGQGGQSWTGAPIATTAAAGTAGPTRRAQTVLSPGIFGWIRFE